MRESLLEIGALLRRGKICSLELTQDCLERIAKLNPILNAFITVTAESALAQARHADAEIQAGRWRGPLHGIPLGIKDLIDTAGIRTTAASAVFKDRIPAEDAEVVRRLKEAGAVLLGKQNLHEFAYGGSSLISYFGAVHNPWNTAHIAGGSSGGSAAAVAADLCYGAVATDTAGSIRQPAALCGVVGLKPTYGSVSVRGVIPLSPSLDHVGPIARSVEDAAAISHAIAGLPHKPLPLSKPLRVGVPRAFFYKDLDPEIAEATAQALKVLAENGAELREISLSVPTDRTLVRGEAYAFHPEFLARSRELYQAETLRRILDGDGITEEELQEKRLELEQTRRDIHNVFEAVDLLVTPATPIPAPRILDLEQDPSQLRPTELVLLRNTRPFNVWGLPAISLPCGFTKAGLPIGLQIAGPENGEDAVLGLALAYEKATDWHTRRPAFTAASPYP